MTATPESIELQRLQFSKYYVNNMIRDLQLMEDQLSLCQGDEVYQNAANTLQYDIDVVRGKLMSMKTWINRAIDTTRG